MAAMETNLIKPNLDATVRKISSVSTLPHIALKIVELTSDPDSTAADLESVIRSDPALTARLLKMSNSAHFGLSERILEIRKAVIFLGFKTVKDLALSASVCELFRNATEIGRYRRTDLWKHSVGVALCSKAISQKSEMGLEDHVFSTGILHDLGIVMIDQYLHDHFIAVLTHPQSEDFPLEDLENEIIGFSHQDLAREVIGSWNLPGEFKIAVSAHHHPSKASRADRPLLAVLYLANTMCNAINFGFVETRKVNPEEFNVSLQILKFTKTDVQILLEDMPEEFEKAKDLMDLADS